MLAFTLTQLAATAAFLVCCEAQSPTGSATPDTEAARFSREKVLKVAVSGEFTDTRIGDILKELAAQVDMKLEQPVMWCYGEGFPFSKKISFQVNEVPLEIALDRLLRQTGDGLGYIVLSREGDRRDGWVLLTTTGERGKEPQPATDDEEKAAAELLAGATRLLDAKKNASARVMLQLLQKKYPTTRAARNAKALLEKVDK